MSEELRLSLILTLITVCSLPRYYDFLIEVCFDWVWMSNNEQRFVRLMTHHS